MMMMIRKIQRREMINQSSMKLSLKLKKKSPKPRLRSRLLKMLSIHTMKIPQRIMMILMQLKERNSLIPLMTKNPLLRDTKLLSTPPKKLPKLTKLPVDILV